MHDRQRFLEEALIHQALWNRGLHADLFPDGTWVIEGKIILRPKVGIWESENSSGVIFPGDTIDTILDRFVRILDGTTQSGMSSHVTLPCNRCEMPVTTRCGGLCSEPVCIEGECSEPCADKCGRFLCLQCAAREDRCWSCAIDRAISEAA